LSEFKDHFREAKSNLMKGYIKIDIDQDSEHGDVLYAHLNTDSFGVDDEPRIELMTRDQDDADGCDRVWIVSVSMLRKLCDAVEALHSAANINFKKTGA
jgi:hypothetical protein